MLAEMWTKGIMSWVAISSVLSFPGRFRHLTYTALKYGPQKDSADDLPIAHMVGESLVSCPLTWLLLKLHWILWKKQS